MSIPSNGMSRSVRELVIYFGIALTISCAIAAMFWKLPVGFHVGDLKAIREAVDTVGLLYVVVPALTALGVTFAFRGWPGLREIGRRLVIIRFSPIYYVLALLIPLAPLLLGVRLWSLLTGHGAVYPPLMQSAVYWVQVTLAGTVILLGEEIGWRGFMLPRLLEKFSWRAAALVGGLLWSLWHFPLWVPANYAATGSYNQAAIMVAAGACGAISLSVVITWLFVRTRYSIALAALLHGSNNATTNIIYDMLGDGAGADATWAISSSVLLVAVALAFLVMRDRPREIAVP